MKDHTEATSLHNKAMELAQQAVLLQNREPDRARGLFLSALEKERAAAEIWESAFNLEPTRSILYRSAAALARDCQDYDEAERLIAKGLAGHPSAFVAQELEELRRLVHSEHPSNHHRGRMRAKA
jgi:tetratricopeptide (TPR) repeat protein